jgi:hypothetical protein
MSHHSSNENDDEMYASIRAALAKQMDEAKEAIGPTGRFPLGKLTRSDEGGIKMAVASVGSKIVIDFGKPVAWVGLTAIEARGLAELLIKHADGAGH